MSESCFLIQARYVLEGVVQALDGLTYRRWLITQFRELCQRVSLNI